jgi:hypothetical protein
MSTLQSSEFKPLYLFTLIRVLFTFARLRYILGGRRPSETTHYTFSLKLVHYVEHGFISLMFPQLTYINES